MARISRSLTASCLFLLFVAARGGTEEAAIHWYNSVKQAGAAAGAADRPMLIDFWADWCEPCKKMDAEVYADKEVGLAAKRKVITVRINFDMQRDLARRYNVEAIPHLVFTNSLGTELIHHRGFINAGDLAALLNAIPEDISELNRLDQRLRENKNDFASLVAMGHKLRSGGFLAASNEYYAKAAAHARARSSVSDRELILREMGMNYLELRDFRAAASTFERYLREVPRNEHTEAVLRKLKILDAETQRR